MVIHGVVSELRATSGERSFALESTALQNIANNGRDIFGFTTLVPGILPNADNGGTRASGPPTEVSGFTANGQRSNGNNIVIDGVANIDTGDNGGNMAELNIDSIEEMKVLTNSYQAESGQLIEPAESSRDDYGYTLGGPIYIPGTFNEDKTKLFFFKDWTSPYPCSAADTRRPGPQLAEARRRQRCSCGAQRRASATCRSCTLPVPRAAD